ncbi:ferrous iron transport protein A [Flavobacterium branchiophilum NBRC 15030 = ATCC 35035]|uniref:Ferrous iron transport protein A n=2 Tax=Flavobacterium branchiophilum TaxID=55197 RepID=G2Z4F1_FLABF|nr:FeoA family protein [Flavobacterium branchiophilum]OXA82221.1 ferrous iron transport protein A [Flavobacterium branchiophilum NBRC 15030 = ATCC 35035]PDS24494.1 ferrous iron transport protein A [Flavobacterium branchiophilum]TQM40780.1 ferrous iron transport protein A [Flavobacterium branchiophilum]CCB68426.1 Ferrous iron transport protein A [Flavobacterium branchiophilum FL-15]GEM55852.1 iron transporter [Flavobacterium branchiophilum NBRC 15030 = ATCC 35035]
MKTTLAQLKKGSQAIIKDFDVEAIPLKLLEMGCLPGNVVELLQVAPFGDPLYLNINGSYLAIRIETAKEIEITLLEDTQNV